MFGQGEASQRLQALQSMSPEQRQALILAQLGPERLRQFEADSSDEQDTYKKQMLQAQQMAFTPVEAQGRTPVAQGANLVANALRMFGGLALAGSRENDLNEARKRAKTQHEELMAAAREGLGAGMGVEEKYLGDSLGRHPASRALLNYRAGVDEL